MVVYLYYIFIFSKNKEDRIHLKIILRKLHDEKLTISHEKCEFMNKELVYIIFLVSKGNIKMDTSKGEAILNYSPPKLSKSFMEYSRFTKIL